MPVRFSELTGTNNWSQSGYYILNFDFFLNVDFFQSAIVAIFTVLLLVLVVAGGLLLLRHYIITPRPGKLWPSPQRATCTGS